MLKHPTKIPFKLLQMNKIYNSEDIGTIMEMFALQFSQAQHIYQQCNFDLSLTIERIMKRKHLLPPNINHRPNDKAKISEEAKGGIAKMTNIQFSGLKSIKQKKQDDHSIKAQLERQAQQRVKMNFRKQYIVKKADKKKLLNYKKRSKNIEVAQQNKSEQFNFTVYFEQYLGKPFQISFRQQLNDVFDELWNKRKLIALHLLNLSQMKSKSKNKDDGIQKDIIHSILKDVYLSQKYCDVFNREFINYGVDPQQFDFITYPHMRQFFNPDKDRFCFIILRLNQKTSKVNLGAKINFFELIAPKDFQGFKKRIIEKKKDINRIIDSQICPSIHHNPLNTADKKKLDQDRSIRNMQQAQYEKMKTKVMESRKKQRESRIEKGEQSEEELQKLKQNVIKSIMQIKAKEREEIKKSLKTYRLEEILNPFHLKLRFPSGKYKLIVLPKEQKIDYIFKYVECCDEQDLGFENNQIRSFDVLQPLKTQGLQRQKDKKLSCIFNDSDAELLIVREN